MRILIAEDDLTSLSMLAAVLKKGGHEVVETVNGMQAWDELQKTEAPKLAILDWIMPGLDGLEVIRRVRAQFVEQPPYIILLTKKSETNDIISGLETGANDYIKKPFEYEELFARIRVGQRTLELQTSLYETQQELAYLATHDSLTGILNRRAILERLSKELSRFRREGNRSQGAGLSVGFFDIDHFKQVNDQHGHQAGDEVLRGLVSIMGSRLRAYDILGRLGGDEFLVVAPGIDKAKCKFLFERIWNAIAASQIKTCAGELSITVSIGIASAGPESSPDVLLDIADKAMYRAKRDGGNRLVFTE